MQLHHSVVEQWRQTTRCRHCNNGNINNANVTCALTTASEKLLSLFEATTHAYTATDYFSQTSPDRKSSVYRRCFYFPLVYTLISIAPLPAPRSL